MTKSEALKILNLKEPYTAETLKKAFRLKANIDHPDLHQHESPEVIAKYVQLMQLDNEANNLLQKLLLHPELEYQDEIIKTKTKWNPPQPPTGRSKQKSYDNIKSSIDILMLNFNKESNKLDNYIKLIKRYISEETRPGKIKVALKQYLDILLLSQSAYSSQIDFINTLINSKKLEYQDYQFCESNVNACQNELNKNINILNDEIFAITKPKFGIKNPNFVKELIRDINKELQMRELIKAKILKKWKFGSQGNYVQMYNYIIQGLKNKQKDEKFNIDELDNKELSSLIKEEKLNFKHNK